MSLQILGIKRLRANYYNKIVIGENPMTGHYNVNIYGNHDGIRAEQIGDRFPDSFRSMPEEDQIKAIIDDYLHNTKICGISDPVTLKNGKAFNVIAGNFGYKQMLLQLFAPAFKDSVRSIQNKYYQDRFDFCYDERGVKTFKIGTSNVESSYDIGYDNLYYGSKESEYFKVLNLRMKDFRLLASEKKFIQELIINLCSKYNEQIQIESVYNTKYEYTRNEVLGYVLRCGDIKIYVPKFEPLSFILVSVYNYNLELRQSRKNNLKRQLVMEGYNE